MIDNRMKKIIEEMADKFQLKPVAREMAEGFQLRHRAMEYEKIFDALGKISSKYIDYIHTQLTISNFQGMFKSDAEKINREFQKRRIERKEATNLYKILDGLIGIIESFINDITMHFQEFQRRIMVECDNFAGREGIPTGEAIKRVREVVNQVKGELPKINFGTLEIDVDSTLGQDKIEVSEFIEYHLGGVVIFPEVKSELRIFVSQKGFEVSENVINEYIVLAFKRTSAVKNS